MESLQTFARNVFYQIFQETNQIRQDISQVNRQTTERRHQSLQAIK